MVSISEQIRRAIKREISKIFIMDYEQRTAPNTRALKRLMTKTIYVEKQAVKFPNLNYISKIYAFDNVSDATAASCNLPPDSACIVGFRTSASSEPMEWGRSLSKVRECPKRREQFEKIMIKSPHNIEINIRFKVISNAWILQREIIKLSNTLLEKKSISLPSDFIASSHILWYISRYR